MFPTVYLNQSFLPYQEASVSPFDRGYLFGDAVYEVIPICNNGKLFKLDHHLQRLKASLEAIYLAHVLEEHDIAQICHDMVAQNKAEQGYLYLQISRGGDKGRNITIDKSSTPTIFAFCAESNFSGEHSKPIQVITCQDLRWGLCSVKSTNLLANTLLKHQASLSGADEAILIRDGKVAEGTTSNVFIVSSGKILTPKLEQHILGGITREVVIELLRENNFDFAQTSIDESELNSADEIWITSSTRGVKPVSQINGTILGNGEPGSYWEQINQLYQDYQKRYDD